VLEYNHRQNDYWTSNKATVGFHKEASIKFAGSPNDKDSLQIECMNRNISLPQSSCLSGAASMMNGVDGVLNQHRRGSAMQIKAPKIVVFSQFTEFLNRLRVDLDEKGIKHELFRTKAQAKALVQFRCNPLINVLLLSREGALGIDLSFATHLFLMDSILDKELEQQVVSRVYRMGCTQSVQVFRLYMRQTIEEDILDLRDRNLATSSPDVSSSQSSFDGPPNAPDTLENGTENGHMVEAEDKPAGHRRVSVSSKAAYQGSSSHVIKGVQRKRSHPQSSHGKDSISRDSLPRLHWLLKRLKIARERDS